MENTEEHLVHAGCIDTSETGIWLWSQRLGVQFLTVHSRRRASLLGLGRAAQSHGNLRKREWHLSTQYLENPGNDHHTSEWTLSAAVVLTFLSVYAASVTLF